MTVEPPEGDGKSIAQIIEEIWQNRDRAYNTRCLVKRLQRIDKQMSGEARELFARFIPDGDVGRFAEDLPSLLRESFADTMRTLRDADFQKLLVDYPRGGRTFIVAPGVTDEVSSEWLIRAGTGKEYKPSDYLEAFASFVHEHQDQVEAIRILLSRPREWGAAPLTELRRALTQAPEHFTEAKPPARVRRRLQQGAGRHHLDGQARGRRHLAAADRRGAGQPGRRSRHRQTASSLWPRPSGWSTSGSTWSTTSRSSARTSTRSRYCLTTAGGDGPTGCSRAAGRAA